MSHRGKQFGSRNNSKGYFNNNHPFRHRDEHSDGIQRTVLTTDHGRGGTSFKHQGRYDPHSNRFDPVYRGKNGRKRGGRNRPRDPRLAFSRPELALTWFKITIPFGKKMDKEFLLKSLMSCSKTNFNPINYHISGQSACFYLDNKLDSDALRRCHRRLTTQDGSKIPVHVSHASPPIPNLNEENLEKIKVVMSNRFNTATDSLDLHSFHSDQDLRREGIYAPLCRQQVMQAVVKIITGNIPQLKSLDFSNNSLTSLMGTNELATVCKDLKRLDLKKNQIHNMCDIGHMKGTVIEDLILDGNPLCDHYKDQASYISDVRSKFPNVIKLDGQDLPPPILFDLGTQESVPPVKGSYFPSSDLSANVLKFLEAFFAFYDSDNRQPLLDAYHEEAAYSMQVAKAPGRPQDTKLLSEYLFEQGNRNLLKQSETSFEEKYLRQGRVAIVSQLCNLPKTQHFPNSMTVDVSHLSPALMMFTVAGLFKEANVSQNFLKAFIRSFLVVPHDQGILIINDTHLVTSPTGEQVRVHRKLNPPVSRSTAATEPSEATMVVPLVSSEVPPAGPITEEMKQQLIIQMVHASKMNIPYSTKCLEEQNWDLQGAMSIFTELNNRGGIPAEAFQPL